MEKRPIVIMNGSQVVRPRFIGVAPVAGVNRRGEEGIKWFGVTIIHIGGSIVSYTALRDSSGSFFYKQERKSGRVVLRFPNIAANT